MKFASLFLWLLILAGPAMAKVSEEEAAALGQTLTPMGAERAGNAKGDIPEWNGGYQGRPPCFRSGRYCDPFADDEPLYTITAALAPEFGEKLSAGQRAMLAKYPDSYKIPVYRSHRSFANPPRIYEAVRKNALEAELAGYGETVLNARLGVPFPRPKDGLEAIWNHRLRYQGTGQKRWNNQVAVTASGSPTIVRIQEHVDFPYARETEQRGGIYRRLIQVVNAPEWLLGSAKLIHYSLDPRREAGGAWVTTPDTSFMRKARSFGYDNPGIGSDGLRTADQTDSFSGPSDRYIWRIVGKREIAVPYNSYRIHDGGSIRELIRPGHLDLSRVRYEIHRVWVVDAFVKPGQIHQYKRRTFYLDEDSWQILLVDLYDARDELWRSQEVHTVMAYDQPLMMTAADVVYDLKNGRYLVQGLSDEGDETAFTEFEQGHFSSANVRGLAD